MQNRNKCTSNLSNLYFFALKDQRKSIYCAQCDSVCALFACLDSILTSPSISSTVVGGGIVSTAAVGSNPFAVGGMYPAAMPVQASPQYMLVQTGSGPCYVPVTNIPFGTAAIASPPAFAAPAAAQFQLPNPQQHPSFAFHGQMHPANPFLVVIFCYCIS